MNNISMLLEIWVEWLNYIPNMHNGTYGMSIWELITKGRHWFYHHVDYEVGNVSIFSGNHKWCDKIPWRDCFPTPYALVTTGNGHVYYYYEQSSNLCVDSPAFVWDGFLKDYCIAHLFGMLDFISIMCFPCKAKWNLTGIRKLTVKTSGAIFHLLSTPNPL